MRHTVNVSRRVEIFIDFSDTTYLRANEIKMSRFVEVDSLEEFINEQKNVNTNNKTIQDINLLSIEGGKS